MCIWKSYIHYKTAIKNFLKDENDLNSILKFIFIY